MKEFFLRLFQHCAWALSVFCLLAFAMEWLMPDSVTPYLHLIPFIIIAILMLGIDALLFHNGKSMLERILVISGMLILCIGIVLSYQGSGMANLLAIIVLIVMMIGAGFFLFSADESS